MEPDRRPRRCVGVPSYEPRLDFLLADTLECVRAALALAQATGGGAWIDVARRLARHMEAAYWADDGGFWDRIPTDHDVGALRYRDHPFELNAAAARVLLDLAHVTGERNWRGLAERTLARTGARAGRYGVAGATFALATAAFFDPSPAVFIAVPAGADAAAAPLRRAAFALRVPTLRVWTVPSGHASGPQQFHADGVPAAYIWTRRGCAGPVRAPDQLAADAGVV